jgi:ankyrin repeat protein
VQVVEALVHGGADVNAVDGEGWSAVHMSADRGHAGVVKALSAAGADVNARVQVRAAGGERDWVGVGIGGETGIGGR